MSFNPIAASSVYDCKKLLTNNLPKAIDLGCQTCSVNTLFLNNLVSLKKIEDKKILENIDALKLKSSFTTNDYFKAVGYYEYASIDINGAYDSYEFDLNLDIFNYYNFSNQYDLVINNGTGEHVFNQHNLYLNFHNLTKKNGIMLNIVPFIDWINHGFYNYNPIFFADLASSNNYEIVKVTLANRDGAELIIPQESNRYFYDQIKPNNKKSEFRDIISYAKEKLGQNILIVSVLKKLSDNIFNAPLQGKYLSDVQNKKTNYSNQKKGSSNALGQIADNVKRKNN